MDPKGSFQPRPSCDAMICTERAGDAGAGDEGTRDLTTKELRDEAARDGPTDGGVERTDGTINGSGKAVAGKQRCNSPAPCAGKCLIEMKCPVSGAVW